MAYDNASSITGQKLRITRLNSDGTTMVGPSASYVTDGFISLTLTPEMEAGTDIVQKNAAGVSYATYKTADTIKRVTVAVGIVNPDPELTEIISGGTILGASQGWAAPLSGTDPTGNGVSIEVWSKAIVNGKPAVDNPYWHWLVPFANIYQTGARVIQEGMLSTEFSGWGVGNSAFGSGPAAPTWPYVSDRAYAYARTASLPVGTGYQTTT